MNIYSERIDLLRKEMAEAGIDVYYIPMSDCHNSEYVADHFRCIEFISGFSGSAGSVVVTADEAWLFADGRYYIQAAHQIEGSGIQLMKIGQPKVPELADFLLEKSAGKVLGFDGSVIPAKMGKKLSGESCTEGTRYPSSISYGEDLVGKIWADRPEQHFSDIYELPMESVGESTRSKIDRIREELAKHAGNRDYLYLINSLDDIAWIFNLRADDIPNNPVFFAYAAITKDKVTLYTGTAAPKGGYESGTYSPACLCLNEYLASSHPQAKSDDAGTIILLDENRISYDVYRFYADAGVKIMDIQNPSTLMKAIKNETEIRCLKEALLKDSAVVINFMYWLKMNVGKFHMDEVSVADYLQELRMQQPGYIELSFGTISAYKENAAQMHYSPKRGACAEIKPEGFLLVDSGCQYIEGTTDITRTFALGPLTQEEKKAFTLTAVSMLRLLHTKFLKGCTGENLDIMARLPMWQEGWDYKCGTGHGVGHILNVHEGPHNIRWKINYETPTAVLEPGMVVTDEPGVYREGEFGIRTENEMLVVPYRETPDGTFYRFENLTFIPIDLDAIEESYLTAEDKKLLNAYHKAVYDAVADRLEEPVKAWLKQYTREL